MMAFAAWECGRICIEAAPFTLQYSGSLISARLGRGECSSPRKETLHLYDVRGQMESLGNKKQVEAYLLDSCHNRKGNK